MCQDLLNCTHFESLPIIDLVQPTETKEPPKQHIHFQPSENDILTADLATPYQTTKLDGPPLGDQIVAKQKRKNNGGYYTPGGKTIADYPHLVAEWDWEANGDLKPADVSYGSTKKVGWKGTTCGHRYQATCNNRTSNNRGCPYCAGKKVCKENCLATLFPDIASEWHKTKNGTLTAKDVVAGSSKRAVWKCKTCGHDWNSVINSRAVAGNGCPYCSNYRVCFENCLATLFPDIAAEWHPTKNGKLKPKDVVAGSRKKVWWKCNVCRCVWKASCANRIAGRGCPYCNASIGEKTLQRILVRLGFAPISGTKFDGCRNKKPLPFDKHIIIGRKDILFEYHGEQHYRMVNFSGKMTVEKMKANLAGVKKRDRIKKDYCKKNHIPLLIIPYWKFEQMEEIVKNFISKQKMLGETK